MNQFNEKMLENLTPHKSAGDALDALPKDETAVLITLGWLSYETAKDIFQANPDRKIIIYAPHTGLFCGHVPG